MNYLLDTHAFLWFIKDDRALSDSARTLIENPENSIYLSIGSVWEMAIKASLGKLDVPTPFGAFMLQQLSENSITMQQISVEHCNTVATLPFHHRDPFDRIIIAQAIDGKWPIIGKDEAFDAYEITRYW